MEKKTPVLEEDLERIRSAEWLPWEALDHRTVLVTGATGLIGSTVISALIDAACRKGLALRVIALVRDAERAKQKFAVELAEYDGLTFAVGDVRRLPEIEGEVHYIIHGASPTASRFFAASPVETVATAYEGTKALLELARAKQVLGMVYLSSMEAYGAPHTDDLLSERDLGYMDPLLVRNCYPESKRLCENLCSGYWHEYQVPVTIARLSQTFGPGVAADDNRVFAQFIRSAVHGEDIILRTKGDSKRTYVYTMDAAAAILTLLLRGEPGEAYNVAHPDTYCSVLEMAQMVARVFSGGRSAVRIELSDTAIYPPAHCYHLDPAKLEGLGWKADVDLEEMYRRMLRGFDR